MQATKSPLNPLKEPNAPPQPLKLLKIQEYQPDVHFEIMGYSEATRHDMVRELRTSPDSGFE